MAGLAAALLVFALSIGAAGARADASGVGDFRTAMEKWVETRQLISREKSEWELERETLETTRELLREQKEALAQEIRELEASSSEADEERRSLLLQRGEQQQASEALEARIRALEQEVVALAPLLPQPLQEKLAPLLVQIPDDPEATRLPLGQRLMNVLGVLAQAEKFDATATFVGETRAVDGDEKVRVRTLYWGLAQAVYVDARGRAAGIGRPGASGWEFAPEPELAGRAERLLDIYEGAVDAIQFVELPVEIR